ncbi:hypothetical protein GF312_11935 [Candidatus Poribacteria bacterium]|nr:hypothetical protein [Candidatus Poribacteria bacterium]
MQRVSNKLLAILLSLMLSVMLLGCGEDDEEDEEIIPEVSKAAYIINGLAETMSVFDIETNEMQNDVVTVGKWPNDIKIKENKAYVVNTGDNNVQVFELDGLTQVGIIDTGEFSSPEKIAFAGNKAYISCNTNNTTVAANLSSYQVTKTIDVGVTPWGVAAAGDKVYVCNSNAVFDLDTSAMSYGDGSVTVIDTSSDSVVKDIPVGINATEIVVSGSVVVVQCTGNYADILGQIYVIDSTSDSVTHTIDLNTTPYGLAISPDGNAYVTAFEGLIEVDLLSGSIGAPMADFEGGSGLAFDDDGNGYICVPDWMGSGNDQLLIMDASGNLAGTYAPGGGAGYVDIRE